ncbi:MAG: tRNA epoxyqueuosine(34) reductase QueG [Hellea sp.]|nr:tRNA epoxyqueuosine(34) reductase QueG [Hellea sp.]
MTALPGRFIMRCQTLGFTRPFVTRTDRFANQNESLQNFVGQGFHGSMDWLETALSRRAHPNNMWPQARSVISLGMNYGPAEDPLANLQQPELATISVYARNRDYHEVMKGRLKEAAGLLANDLSADVKVFVDTAPLMEKPIAQLAGLGWQGKHTNLVSREYGSWLFLGTILTDAELTPDAPETDHCGNCRACLDICPTDAFPGPYKLDARKCISYLTIEHDGPVDEKLRSKMGNRIYGCDDCLAVCPWNKFAQQAAEQKLAARDDLKAPKLAELAALSEADFRQKFAGSPIKRIGAARFKRNVLYAIGNSGLKIYLTILKDFTNDPDPVIAEAANWAVEQIKKAGQKTRS